MPASFGPLLHRLFPLAATLVSADPLYTEHAYHASRVLRRRNEIVSLNLVVNCAMLCFATVSGVTGTFGMNFSAWMPQDHSKSLVSRQI